jgi:inhibitor of cysteine peptidase
MSRKIRLMTTMIIAFAAMAAIITGCGGSGPTEYSAAEAARGVKIAVGEQFTVALDSNQTTGFSWSLGSGLDTTVVKKLSQDYQETNTGAVGAGGTDRWTFTGVNVGETTIKLQYSRPWVSGASPEKTEEIKVTVTQ